MPTTALRVEDFKLIDAPDVLPFWLFNSGNSHNYVIFNDSDFSIYSGEIVVDIVFNADELSGTNNTLIAQGDNGLGGRTWLMILNTGVLRSSIGGTARDFSGLTPVAVDTEYTYRMVIGIATGDVTLTGGVTGGTVETETIGGTAMESADGDLFFGVANSLSDGTRFVGEAKAVIDSPSRKVVWPVSDWNMTPDIEVSHSDGVFDVRFGDISDRTTDFRPSGQSLTEHLAKIYGASFSDLIGESAIHNSTIDATSLLIRSLADMQNTAAHSGIYHVRLTTDTGNVGDFMTNIAPTKSGTWDDDRTQGTLRDYFDGGTYRDGTHRTPAAMKLEAQAIINPPISPNTDYMEFGVFFSNHRYDGSKSLFPKMVDVFIDVDGRITHMNRLGKTAVVATPSETYRIKGRMRIPTHREADNYDAKIGGVELSIDVTDTVPTN